MSESEITDALRAQVLDPRDLDLGTLARPCLDINTGMVVLLPLACFCLLGACHFFLICHHEVEKKGSRFNPKNKIFIT